MGCAGMPELDRFRSMGLKEPMTRKAAVSVRRTSAERLVRELERVEAKRNELWNELSAHAEEMNERAARGAPVQRLLAAHQRMRERYCVVENRRQELLAVVPPRPAPPDDF
jgi:hypothetical protein